MNCGNCMKLEAFLPVVLMVLVGIGAVSCRGGNTSTEIAPHRVESAPGGVGDSANHDSAAMLRLPRRVRGIVFDSVNGHRRVAVGNTRIRLDLGSPLRLDSVTADSFGRYDVRNPPIGQLVMVAYCPSTPTWKGTVNGVVFLEVRPGIDTVVNIAVDPPNCAEPPPTQRRDTGSVNTHGHANAQYPVGDAAAVYREMIDYLYARDGKPPYVLLRDPAPRHCFGGDCGERELFRMVQNKVIDSSTVRNFEIATARRVSLTPQFGYSGKVVLLTEEDLDYVRQEQQRWRNIGQLPTGADTSGLAAFRSAFPGARDVVHLSAVGFNRSRTEALVEAGKSAGPYREKGQLMLLRKADRTWRIIYEDIGKTRTTGSWEGNRCVAAEAPVRSPSRGELESLSGEYELVAMRNGIREKRYGFTLVLEPPDSNSKFPLIPRAQRARLETLADGPITSERPPRARPDSAGPRFTLSYDGKMGELHTSESPEKRKYLAPRWNFDIGAVSARGFFGRWSYFSGIVILNESDNPPEPLAVSQYFCARAVRRRAPRAPGFSPVRSR